MTAEAISIRVQIGATTYTLDEVGDPKDAMFAVQLGRTIAEAIIAYE